MVKHTIHISGSDANNLLRVLLSEITYLRTTVRGYVPVHDRIEIERQIRRLHSLILKIRRSML